MSALRLIVGIGGPLAKRRDYAPSSGGAQLVLSMGRPYNGRTAPRCAWHGVIDREAHGIRSAAAVSTRRGYRFDRGIRRPRRLAPERARARAGAETGGRQTRWRRRSRADLPIAHGPLRS